MIMRICPRCNYHITNDNARFCHKCGLNLVEAEALIQKKNSEELRLKLDLLESIKNYKLEKARKKKEEKEQLKRAAMEAAARLRKVRREERERVEREKAEKERKKKEKLKIHSKRRVTRVMSKVFFVISLGLGVCSAILIKLNSRPGDGNVWNECIVGGIVFFLLPWVVWWVLVRWICQGIDNLLGRAKKKYKTAGSSSYMGSSVLLPPPQSTTPFYGLKHNSRGR